MGREVSFFSFSFDEYYHEERDGMERFGVFVFYFLLLSFFLVLKAQGGRME